MGGALRGNLGLKGVLVSFAVVIGMCLCFAGKASAAGYAYFVNDSGDLRLVLANEDGEERRTYIKDTATQYLNTERVALSANGRYLAYCIYLEDSTHPYGWRPYVGVDDVNTGETVVFTAQASCTSLDFSPGGGRLLVGGGSSNSDIWELTLDDEPELSPVVTWGGDQYGAHYTAGGQQIVFHSNANAAGEMFGETWPYEWHLFKTDLSGGSATNLTKGSYLWTEAGADYAMEPDVRVNGTTVVFECGYQQSGGGLGGGGIVWHLCRINTDGSGAMDLGLAGRTPSWNPEGTKVIYTARGEFGSAMEASPTGESPTALPLKEVEGRNFIPVGVVPRQSGSDLNNLARNFAPKMRLDEGERWRPLDVDQWFEEVPPRVCQGGSCQMIFSLDELGEASGSNPSLDVLDVPTMAGQWDTEPHVNDADEYGSSDCSDPEDPGVDCENLQHSAIYYDGSDVSPGGYRFLEYWFFYRFNDSPVDTVPGSGELLDHEADWEHVAVGVPDEDDPDTFDFVTFGQHGGSYAYLRSNLTCGGGGECGPAAKRVHVFPAGGTHASYAGVCTATIYVFPCTNQNGYPESDHGGEVDWVGNHDLSSLIKLPPVTGGAWLEGPQSFTDWPGKWGFNANFESKVASPANQDEWAEPWEAVCNDSGEGCDREEEAFRASAAQGEPESPEDLEAAPGRCLPWFGPEVTAVFCGPEQLQDSLAHAAIGRRKGTATLVVVRGGDRDEAATTGGLAQLAGAPLRPGNRLLVKGSAGSDAVILVRAILGDRLTESVYPARGIVSVNVERQRLQGGGFEAAPVARTAAGRTVTPEEVEAVTLRAP